MSDLPRVVVIGGQTASGKSALALSLAVGADDGVPGELVCADSRQVYAGLQVAAAGPDADERSRAPHHLYGAFDPATTTVNAGVFVDAADAAITAILARGHRAIVVGGTGLYLRSLRLGLDEAPPGDPAVRARLQADLEAHGLPALVEQLRRRDPDIDARDLDLQNPVRVLRALEILEAGGSLADRDLDALLRRRPRPIVADAVWWLVSPSVDVVEQAIAARTRRMFGHGVAFGQADIVDEAKTLAAHLPEDHALLATIGTQEALDVASGRRSVEDAIDAVVVRTRQYARRQRTWFRREPWWQLPQPERAGVVDGSGERRA
jgi:tRNA dimethylallyltransferase